MHRIAGHLGWPDNQFGDRFVRCKYYAAYADAPGAQTDWDHSGTHLAAGIQNGVPGVTGIGLLAWDLHYPLAYGYRIVESISDGEVVDTNHYFQCNMGHGPGEKPQYHNASDVWFGLTAQFWQEFYPASPNDIIAATFTTPDRVDVYTRASLRQFQRSSNSQADQTDWIGQWKDLPTGKFLSGPAACVSRRTSAHDDAAQSLFVFGLGDDYRIWQGQSQDNGATWNLAWEAIGERHFTSSPAACMSGDGQTIHVFARGDDNRIWRIHSHDGGSTWDGEWTAMGAGLFTSGPAACVSSERTESRRLRTGQRQTNLARSFTRWWGQLGCRMEGYRGRSLRLVPRCVCILRRQEPAFVCAHQTRTDLADPFIRRRWHLGP